MLTTELTILTLNVWGIPCVSSDRRERIAAISSELNSGQYDIVSLQEVWSQLDSEKLQQQTATVLPHAHYFHSGVIGAGLLVLSKYPIIGTLFHAWSVNGYFHRIQHADWFGGKGVGLCRILVEDQIVHLYNAHLHAEYDNKNDEYKTHRVIQAFDTAQFIEATRGSSVLQILAGDLNTQPDDISYKVLLYTSKMSDSCVSNTICTNECPRNSYTSKKSIETNPNGIRIDHIFIRSADHLKAEIVNYNLPLPERVPGKSYSYSDHEAVFAKLKLHLNDHVQPESVTIQCGAGEGTSNAMDNSCNINERKHHTAVCSVGDCGGSEIERRTAVLQESINLCDDSLRQLHIDRIFYYCFALFLFILLIVLAELSFPWGFKTVFLLIKLIIFGFILFCLFMASIWNFMERNGILSGKIAMEIMLRNAKKYDFYY